MPFFVSIYTDPFIFDNYPFTDYTNILSILFGVRGATHTFISLTIKSPYELSKENERWYEKNYSSIIENEENIEGFFGFGTAEDKNTDKGDILFDYLNGKVYENNQFISNASYLHNTYITDIIRGDNVFQNGVCQLEISEERYYYLLNIIRKELLDTYSITPRSDTISNPKYQYHLTDNNCTQWVQRMLNEIGVEQYLFHIDYVTIPEKYADLYQYIYYTNEIIKKLGLIDNHLLTVEGVNTVKFWMRVNFYNLHDIKSHNFKDLSLFKIKSMLVQEFFGYDINKSIDELISCLFKQYLQLQEYIDNICQKNANGYCTGTFHFIYVDNGKFKIMKPENDYVPEDLQELDASKPYNHYTLSKYLYFIFKPGEEYDYIYHKYNYGKVDEDYNSAVNECYKQVLLGQTDNIKYYSQSLNKLLTKQNKENMYNV